MAVTSEMTIDKMKERMKTSPINSHRAFELTYKNRPAEALSIKIVPYMELGKVYHMEVYNYHNVLNKRSGHYDTWLCIPIQFANQFGGSSNVFKVLACNHDGMKPSCGTGYADIKCDTFWGIQFYRNIHEVSCKEFPLYLHLDYLSPMFTNALKEGELNIYET